MVVVLVIIIYTNIYHIYYYTLLLNYIITICIFFFSSASYVRIENDEEDTFITPASATVCQGRKTLLIVKRRTQSWVPPLQNKISKKTC